MLAFLQAAPRAGTLETSRKFRGRN